MSDAETHTDREVFEVVVNDEDQYSIWPGSRPLPEGWRRAGFQGARQACLDHIESVWTDITPKSLRS